MLYPVNEDAVECGKQNTAEFFRLHIFSEKELVWREKQCVIVLFFRETIFSYAQKKDVFHLSIL